MQNLPELQLVKIWDEFDVVWIRARPGGLPHVLVPHSPARSALPGPFPAPRPVPVLNSVDIHVLQVIKPLHNDYVWLFIPTIVIRF